jgi:hypothetical protein
MATATLVADPFPLVVPSSSSSSSFLNSPTANSVAVNYTGFSPVAQTAFQYAVDIINAALATPVPITVNAQFTPLGASTLGSAGPTSFQTNFTGAPQINTAYPVALANQLSGIDLNGSNAEITASFNSSFTDWYFGIDRLTPNNQYDFVTVVLHELTHGLGFIGAYEYNSGTGSLCCGPNPSIFDTFLRNGSGVRLSALPAPSTALGSELVSDNLFFDGANATTANGGSAPKLYAPTTYSAGSSVYHLDNIAFTSGSANSLMRPALSPGVATHSLGPVALGMFQDMGWQTQSNTAAGVPFEFSPIPGLAVLGLIAAVSHQWRQRRAKQPSPRSPLN